MSPVASVRDTCSSARMLSLLRTLQAAARLPSGLPALVPRALSTAALPEEADSWTPRKERRRSRPDSDGVDRPVHDWSAAQRAEVIAWLHSLGLTEKSVKRVVAEAEDGGPSSAFRSREAMEPRLAALLQYVQGVQVRRLVAMSVTVLSRTPEVTHAKVASLRAGRPDINWSRALGRWPNILTLSTGRLLEAVEAVQAAVGGWQHCAGVVERHPGLLTRRSSQIAQNTERLRALVPPGVDVEGLLRAQPSLLAAETGFVSLIPVKMGRFAAAAASGCHGWAAEIAEWSTSMLARNLTCSENVIDRLDFLSECAPEGRGMAASPALRLTEAQFAHQFPEWPAWAVAARAGHGVAELAPSSEGDGLQAQRRALVRAEGVRVRVGSWIRLKADRGRGSGAAAQHILSADPASG